MLVGQVRRLASIAVASVMLAHASHANEGFDLSPRAMPLPAEPAPEVKSQKPESFGAHVERAAALHEIPSAFFARLIWQESRFDPLAVSPAGALGIAQFMPGTARWRGLADPFEPTQALYESARWLRELWSEFGNLGLAAAAYNAGPERVRKWLAGGGTLPAETRAYVRIITGQAVDDWAKCAPAAATDTAPAIVCPELPKAFARALAPPRADREQGWGPWGLQLIGNWSEARALADYRKLQSRFSAILGDRKPIVLKGRMAGRGPATWYRVRIAEATRDRANELCSRLARAGGKCVVMRN